MQTTDEKSLGIVSKMFEDNKFTRDNILGSPSSRTNET